MTKKTYKCWVRDRYYHFNTFKIYWACCWSIAEELDQIGVLGGTHGTKNIRFDRGYRFKYLPAGPELDYYRALNPTYHTLPEWLTSHSA